MNLANKAFKNTLKKLFPKFVEQFVEQAKQAVGDSATNVHFRASQTITDPEKIKQITESTTGFARKSGAGEWLPEEQRTIERAMEMTVGEYTEKTTSAYKRREDEFFKKIDNVLGEQTDPTQRRAELEEVVGWLTSYCQKLPVKTKEVVDMLENNNYKGARKFLETAFYNEGLALAAAQMNDGLVKTFVDPNIVDSIIKKAKETRLKGIFYPTLNGKSKFEIEADKYIKANTKKMSESEKTKFIEEFRKKYPMPESVEKADSDFFKKHIEFYNDLVEETEQVKYGLREQLTDKYQLWAQAQKELGEFGTPLVAKELTKNNVLKMFKTGSGLVTNMAKAFSWFKGIEDFTANSLGYAMDYFEKLPKFKTRNNELAVAAGVALKKYKLDELGTDKQLALQRNIRNYIENLTKEGQLTQIDYNGHGLTANVELMQKFGLNADDVEFTNKLINALRLTKRHMDLVTDGLYDNAAAITKRFDEIDGLNLSDVSDMRRNHPTFGFVDDYFPIVPTPEYKESLSKMSPADRTSFEYLIRQNLDLMDEKRIEPTFFLRMRRIGESAQGSKLKNDPMLRRAPADEFLIYAKSIDNYYKGRGYQYFDQIENAHILYNTTGKYGREEALARNDLIHGLRKQYDEAVNPLALGDTKFETLLSSGVMLEAGMALTSPRMWFFNALQGLQMGGSIAGYWNHARAVIKNTFGAAGWALHQKLTGGEGYFGRARFIEECWKGKFDKQLFGDDAIIANNIGAYFRDEPLSGLSLADVKYLVSKSIDEKLRMRDTKVGKAAANILSFANYGFMLSEKIARASTIDASTKHFLDSARKTIAHIKAHPEMSNPEAVRFFAKELHLDALNNTWKVDKILNNVTGEDLAEALSDNKVLQRMSQDYAFACVKHQIFEYDAINQSALKSHLKHTTKFGGMAMTFKQWGFHWSEYAAGIIGAAYHGDTAPLKKLGMQTLAMVAAASYLSSLGEKEKYKKGKPQDFEKWLKQGIANTARYARQREPFFTPVSIAQMPMDEIAGLTKPVVGLGLFAAAGIVNVAAMPFTGKDDLIFEWAQKTGGEAVLNSVTVRKIKDIADNIKELGGK